MRLFIAEKPSMAREIAGVLGNVSKSDGYLTINNDVVTWCFGHILEQVSPEKYDEKYKFWKSESLPIVPEKWQMQVSEKCKKQFKIIKELIKKADEIVNAGDPDREGQLLIDEVLDYVSNKKPVKRILLNALDEESIKKALNDLRNNKDFEGLKKSALGRQRADWLIGINFTRLFTLIGKNKGYKTVFSVGRVQTPTLMLVANRENEVKKFKPQKYYDLKAKFEVSLAIKSDSIVNKADITASWKCDKKIFDIDEIQKIQDKLNSYANKERAIITNFAKTTKKIEPPLPYSLASLQVDAGKYSYSPQQVLDTVQSLYEKKLLTYPRSDCEYLPESQFIDAEQITKNILSMFINCDLSELDINLKSKAWNDKKVASFSHHAIIPTKIKFPDNLNEKENNIYKLVAFRYCLQFLPVYIYEHSEVEFTYAREVFTATGNVIKKIGWKKVVKTEAEDEKTLPAMSINDNANYLLSEITEKTTKSPTLYTEATLLKDMTEVHKYIENPKLKERLKNLEGIGTSATRASIIQGLLDKEYMKFEKKKLVVTDKARFLLNILPKSFTPEMTAIWESELNNIKETNNDIALENFIKEQITFITEICNLNNEDAKWKSTEKEITGEKCPECDNGVLVEKKGKFGTFFACNNYPSCKYIKKEQKEMQVQEITGEKCPECEQGTLVKREGKYGPFISCNNYPNCKYIKKLTK